MPALPTVVLMKSTAGKYRLLPGVTIKKLRPDFVYYEKKIEMWGCFIMKMENLPLLFELAQLVLLRDRAASQYLLRLLLKFHTRLPRQGRQQKW